MTNRLPDCPSTIDPLFVTPGWSGQTGCPQVYKTHKNYYDLFTTNYQCLLTHSQNIYTKLCTCLGARMKNLKTPRHKNNRLWGGEREPAGESGNPPWHGGGIQGCSREQPQSKKAEYQIRPLFTTLEPHWPSPKSIICWPLRHQNHLENMFPKEHQNKYHQKTQNHRGKKEKHPSGHPKGGSKLWMFRLCAVFVCICFSALTTLGLQGMLLVPKGTQRYMFTKLFVDVHRNTAPVLPGVRRSAEVLPATKDPRIN